MADEAAQLTIGEVARRTGMTTSRIRYYESRGVLPPAARISGMRRYGPDVIRRLAIIDVAQRVGFTLVEIRELLASGHGAAHQRLRHLAARKLPEIDALIRHAGAVRRWLEMTSACECESLDLCSLFDDRVLTVDAGSASAQPPTVLVIASSAG